MKLNGTALVGLTFLLVSCGTRASGPERGASARANSDLGSAAAPVAADPGISASPVGGGEPTPVPGSHSQAGADRDGAAITVTSRSVEGPSSAAAAPPVSPSPSRMTPKEPGSPVGAAKPAPGTEASPGASTTTAASPAVVASIGSLSGPVGSVMAPVVEGVQVWVKQINARGGVGGHLVKLLVYDDGTDPARHRSQVQEAVEVKKVIAFVGNPEGFTGGASQEYITAKRVPVIGSETGSDHFYKSPMYFPQAPHGSANFRVAIRAAAQQTVPLGKVKLATITCAEVQQCEDADRVWAQDAPGLGFRHSYRARAALTQPDFTAECLAARNAGAQVFLLGLDAASIGRVAASCARQGYKPIFGTFSGLIVDRMKDDPNLAGMVASSNVFPYFQSGTPATDEYQLAFKTYGSKLQLGVGSANGWVAAKLFEKAAAKLPEPPTAAAVLAGLWVLRNDTLGGLTQPLTFVENQPAKPVDCWFNMTIRDKAWTSPDSFTAQCLESD